MVGESGCGKSTLARIVALIEKPTGGTLTLGGVDAVHASPAERVRLRKSVQMVFQNPYGSLNPRKKIGAILEAPLAISTDLSRRGAGRPGARDARPRSACGPSTTRAIRTCSPAASGNGSRSPGR